MNHCMFFIIGLLLLNCLFIIKLLYKQRKTEINWHFAKDKLPEDKQEIVAVFSDFVCIGVREDDKIVFTEFIGMPFYDLKDLRWWCDPKEFKKIKQRFNK